MRDLWDEPRPPGAPARVWRDWALVGLVVPLALLEWALRSDLPWRTISVIINVGLAPVLLWRRTRPLLVIAVAFGISGLVPLFTGGDDLKSYTTAYFLILPYALFRWGSVREAVIGSSIVLGKVGVSLALGALSLGDMIGGFAVLSSAAALGVTFRYREKSRLRAVEQVRLLERERLARDLHDTVAHHVSAIAIRAQAGLATAATQPDAATDALRVIEAEASRALTEMRAMVRILRQNQPADREPRPQLADLARLSDPGHPSVEVELAGDLSDLPPTVETAIYRLAQESVTNARRHARHSTRIEVRVAADEGAVHLRVSDDGDTSVLRPAGPPGFGLLGMIERAGMLGGTCEAGPAPGRGWTVSATLPRTGTAA